MNDENTAHNINSSDENTIPGADTLPTALTSLVKTNLLLDNVRSLELSQSQDLNTEAVAEIIAGKDLVVIGKPRKNTFVPVLVGAIEKLTLGYDNNVILIITPNTKYNTIIYDLVTKLCRGTDILHANCSARNSKREIDTRLFVGSFEAISKGLKGNKIPAAETSLIVLPQFNTALETTDLDEVEEMFSAMPKRPQIVITTVDQKGDVSTFVKKLMTEAKEITITGQETMIEHTYSEVGSDLLDKTNALCDIIETSSSDGVLVFCNSDSDTDLAQVIMRKRGFGVERILSDRAERDDSRDPADIMRQVADKEISAVITNDQALDGIDLDLFDLVINYGIPQDPTLYMSRIGNDSAPTKLTKVISLVGSLDFTNFHVIKKAISATLTLKPLPAKEDVLAAKIARIAIVASKGDYSKDERITQLIPLIMDNPSRDNILSMLLHNTLTVLPELKKAKEAPSRSPRPERAERTEKFDRYDRGGDDDNRQDDRRGGRRERGGWGDRDDSRDRRGASSRGGDRDDSRGDRGGDRDGGREGGSDGDRGGQYGRNNRNDDRGGDRSRGRGGDRGERGGDRRDRGDRGSSFDGGSNDRNDGDSSDYRNQEPPKKDVRFYIGQGTNDGFSKELLAGLMTEHCSLTEADIKRLSIRSRYSFADFAEENAPAIIEKLAGASLKSGSPLFVKKATIISTPRERVARDDNDNSGSDDAMNEGSANGDTNDGGDTNSGDKGETAEESNGDNYQI